MKKYPSRDRDLKRLKKKLGIGFFPPQGVSERERKSLEEAHNEGYNEGIEDGYDKAMDKFLVHAPCAICGRPIYVDRDKQKIELARFMRSNGWCHLSCKDAQRRYRR